MPKQFLDILGVGKSLIRLTFERFLKLCPAENIFIVTNGMYKDLVLEHLPELNQYSYSIIICCGPTRQTKNDIFLQINPNFEISVSDINANANKRILIVDNCIPGVHKSTTKKIEALHLFDESLYGLTLNTIES